MAEASGDKKPLFRPLNPDDDNPESTKVESLCLNCGDNGTTQILLTKIPFYKEVILMSFECEHCGYKNNEIQSGGQFEEKGVRIVLNVKSSVDLNRQVCKSDYTSIRIPELDFEIPSQSQKGEITTVEGIIDRSIEALEQDQPRRREEDPENAGKIDEFIKKLQLLKEDLKFTMIIEDVSGNSFVSNPHAPEKDTEAVTTHFVRTIEQDHLLGIYKPDEVLDKEEEKDVSRQLKPVSSEEYSYDKMIQEVMQFNTNCSNCNSPCQTNMKLTNIPHFKEVVIMATNCEYCGNRTNEIKSGGGIEPHGVKLVLNVTKPEDFSRDVLKSDTCSLEIPELKLEVGCAALSGRFTTVEGLLVSMKEQLVESNAMFQDTQDPEVQKRLEKFVDQFDDIRSKMKPFTLILDDPAGSSYIQSLTHPDPDPRLKITTYERNFDQNEELGLNDMKVENYEEDS